MAMKPKTQKIIIGIFFAMCAAMGLMYLIKWLSPTEEDLKTVATLNRHDEMVKKGGHVESVNFITKPEEMLEMLDQVQSIPEDRKARWRQRIEERANEQRDHEDNDRMFWSEIYDDAGNKIGIVRGFRVEGFGIARPHYEWLDAEGNVIESTPVREFRRRGPGGDGPRGDRDGGGRRGDRQREE